MIEFNCTHKVAYTYAYAYLMHLALADLDTVIIYLMKWWTLFAGRGESCRETEVKNAHLHPCLYEWVTNSSLLNPKCSSVCTD